MTAAHRTTQLQHDRAARDRELQPASAALLSPSVWRGWDSSTTALLAPAPSTRS